MPGLQRSEGQSGRGQRAPDRGASPRLPAVALFVAQRLGFGLVVLVSIVFLSYLGLDMAGGADLGPAAGRALSNTAAHVLSVLRGDMGLTTAGSDTALPRAVGEVLIERLPKSLGLLGISLLLAALVGCTLGILAAYSGARRSLIILLATLVGISIPSFFAAFLLQSGAIAYTRWRGRALLPMGGMGWDEHLILPALVLAARPIAQITRIAFVTVSDILSQDYVRTARSKGLGSLSILTQHVLRNAAIPILTTIGISLRFSLSSLPLVEFYFGWPGAGFSLLKGIAQRDDNLTVALVLCLGLLFILVNLALELAYRLIDPRLLQPPAHVAARSGWTLAGLWQSLIGALGDVAARVALWRRAGRGVSRQQRSSPPAVATPPGRAELDQPHARPRRSLLHNVPLAAGSILLLALLVIVLIGPVIAPNDPSHTQGLISVDGQFVSPPFAPSAEYPWGSDALGRGLLSLILVGARQTLMLAVLAVAARTLVGVVLGAISGWTSGSALDRAIGSLAEVIASFPTLLLAMALILALGIRRGMPPFVIALCFVGWGEIMQLVRSQVIAIRPLTYIESAVAVGARPPRIVARHVIPNLLSSLISVVSLEMGAVMMLLGELGFISIFIGGGTVSARIPGVRVLYSDVPEWGALLSSARYMARSYPWTALYPMLAFTVSIVSFNLFGEGVRRMVEQGGLFARRLMNRYTLGLAVVAVVVVRWLTANTGAMPFYRQHAIEFDGARAWSHLEALADPGMLGRALGTPGMEAAAGYIAEQYQALGLQAAGQDGTYFQERQRSFERLTAAPTLTLSDGGPPPVYGIDFAVYPSPYASLGRTTSPLRALIVARPSSFQSGVWRVTYPDLYNADFGGEVLLTLSDREADMVARMGKDGLLVVADDPARLARRESFGGRPWREATPNMLVSPALAERLLAGSGYTLDRLEKTYGEMTAEAVLQVPLQPQIAIEVQGEIVDKWPVHHVLGYIPGTHGYDFCTDCLGKNLIVVMAQYDSPPLGPTGEIYAAANDNASGVAVMLEAIRVIQETEYQPYKTLLFVAYSGEGFEGGETAQPDLNRFLQARPGMSKYEPEAIIELRGVGAGTGRRLQVSASGSLRLAELVESAARRTGARVVRADEGIDIAVIYGEGGAAASATEPTPTVLLHWEGWEKDTHLAADALESVSAERLERTGRALSLALMVLGREIAY